MESSKPPPPKRSRVTFEEVGAGAGAGAALHTRIRRATGESDSDKDLFDEDGGNVLEEVAGAAEGAGDDGGTDDDAGDDKPAVARRLTRVHGEAEDVQERGFTSFNLTAEREDGSFDAEGNWIPAQRGRSRRSGLLGVDEGRKGLKKGAGAEEEDESDEDDGRADPWLETLDGGGDGAAAPSHPPRAAVRRSAPSAPEAPEAPLDPAAAALVRARALNTLAVLLRSGENVASALRRLGGGTSSGGAAATAAAAFKAKQKEKRTAALAARASGSGSGRGVAVAGDPATASETAVDPDPTATTIVADAAAAVVDSSGSAPPLAPTTHEARERSAHFSAVIEAADVLLRQGLAEAYTFTQRQAAFECNEALEEAGMSRSEFDASLEAAATAAAVAAAAVHPHAAQTHRLQALLQSLVVVEGEGSTAPPPRFEFEWVEVDSTVGGAPTVPTTHGPYDAASLLAWSHAGFFSSRGVRVRLIGATTWSLLL